jgi:hypothetical protein
VIDQFTTETEPLTAEEMQAARIIARKIKGNIGENAAVTSDNIIKFMAGQYEFKLSGARLRKIINHIRRERMVTNLVASSKGYYVETDPLKIAAYVDSLLSRSEAIREVALSFNTIQPAYAQGDLFPGVTGDGINKDF